MSKRKPSYEDLEARLEALETEVKELLADCLAIGSEVAPPPPPLLDADPRHPPAPPGYDMNSGQDATNEPPPPPGYGEIP